jgi:hypothetical protein
MKILTLMTFILIASCSKETQTLNKNRKNIIIKENDTQEQVNLQWTDSTEYDIVTVKRGESAFVVKTLINRGEANSKPLQLTYLSQSTNLKVIENFCLNRILQQNESCTINIKYEPSLVSQNEEKISFFLGENNLLFNVLGVALDPNSTDEVFNAPNLSLTTKINTPLSYVLTNASSQTSILDNVDNGTLNFNNSGGFTYIPNNNFFGTDSFYYSVSDGSGNKTIGVVTIAVINQNNKPITQDIFKVGQVGNNFVTLLGTDSDGNNLSYTVVSSPYGSYTVQGSTLTYVAPSDFNGDAIFTYFANDGTENSNISTVTIRVPQTNTNGGGPGSGNGLSLNDNYYNSTNEDTPLDLVLVNDSSYTYTIMQLPLHGTLSGTSPNLTFTPALNYNGLDSFTYKVTQNGVDSNTANVNITINPINDNPVSYSQNINTNENQTVGIILTGDDVEGSALNYSIVITPANGTISGILPNISYTPNSGFNGSDFFTYKVNDGGKDSNVSVINISVASINNAPVAFDQTVSLSEDIPSNVLLNGNDPDGNILIYSIVTQPNNGTISGTAPNLTYTPSPNFNGTDSFSFKVNDGTLDSNIANISLIVNSVNDAPLASSDTITLNEDSSSFISLNGTDIDGDTLAYIITVQPSNGSLTGTAPNLTYTPSPNFNGTDSFSFKVNDGSSDSNTANISLIINNINDAPVALDSSYNTIEDSPVLTTLLSNDDDGDVLTYVIINSPTNGALSGTAPNLTYTPNPNFNGTDSFTFKSNDGNLDSNVATINIQISNNNDIPVTNDDSFTLDEDTVSNIILNYQDADGDSVTYSIATQPVNGILSGTAPNLTYTPNPNFNGTDSFSFFVSDADGDSNTSTITLTVNPINDAPTSNNISITVNEDSFESFVLDGFDVDGDSLLYIIDTQPTNGALSGTAPNLTYTPNSNYNGVDSFSYHVNDGTVDSNISVVNISVSNDNDLPTANNINIMLNEDSSSAVTLSAQDLDGDALTYVIVTSPINGTLSGTAPNLTYTPNPNFNGTDSFSYYANDGTGNSNTSNVLIQINPVNDIPVSNDLSLSTNEDTLINFVLSASDVDSDLLTYSIITQPINGTLSGTAPNLTYTPNPNFNGNDSFTFKVNDGTVDSSIATVSLVISSANDAPTTSDLSLSLIEDNSLNFILSGNDSDGDILTFIIDTQPTNGVLSGTAPNLTYTPNANFNGSDSFSYRVNDGTVDSNVSTVSFSVSPENDNPTTSDVSVNVIEDSSESFILLGDDVDGDTLTYIILTQPTNGVLSGTAPNLTYTPNPNFNGTDSFTYKVNDGTFDSNNSIVNISISQENDAPVIMADSISLNEDESKNIQLVASDSDGDTLTYIIVTSPSNGTLSGTAPNLTYTPNPNFNGTDSFEVKVNDGTLDSSTVTISLTVNSINDAPAAQSQLVNVIEDSSESFILLGNDVDGDALTYVIVTSPISGLLSGTAPNLTYTPNSNFNGSDSFTYKVNDGNLDSSIETISISVSSVNDIPVADDTLVTTTEDSSVNVLLTATDVDGDTLTYVVDYQPTNGTLSGTAPNLTYTPNSNYSGSDSFTFFVNDGTSNSNTATVSIIVSSANDTPVTTAFAISVDEDLSENFMLLATDADGDTLSYSIDSQPTNGTLSGTAPNLTYTPNPNFNGSDSFTFFVNDGTSNSNNSVVSITINSINDAPQSSDSVVTVIENTSKTFSISSTDIEGDPLSLVTINSPTNGIISGTFPNLTYTPNNGFVGMDSLEYKVSDGSDSSPTYTVTFNVTPVAGNGINANYFTGYSPVTGIVGSEVVPTINFNYASGEPFPGVGSDDFSIRYEGYFKSDFSELYTLFTNSDDGVRLWVNGTLLINNWTAHSAVENSATINLIANEYNHIVIEYFERNGVSQIELRWSSPSVNKSIIPTSNLYSDKKFTSPFRDKYSVLTLNRTATLPAAGYPVLINLNTIPATDEFWSHVQSDGADIVVSVNQFGNRVPVEVVSIDKTNKTGELWLKMDVSELSVNSLFIHYNDTVTPQISKDSDISTFGSQSVWSNGFLLVLHMSESFGPIKDSSSGSLMTNFGSPVYGTSGVNNLGKAIGFNNDGSFIDYFKLSTNTSRFNISQEFTIQSWANISEQNKHAVIFKKEYSSDYHGAYALLMDKRSPLLNIDGPGVDDDSKSGFNLPLNTWFHTSTTFNNATDNAGFYVNGFLVSNKSNVGSPSISTGFVEVGGTSERNDHYFSGVLDEVRVSNSVRNFNWIYNDYYSMRFNESWILFLRQ